MIFNRTDLTYEIPAHRVGGKIFYIDSTATGAAYVFYDSQGNVLTDVQVGDTPYSCRVSGAGNKDKYYVFNDELDVDKKWTYKQNGSWIYNDFNSGTAIGTGKSNTATVMNADNGKYVTETGGGDTVWAVINRLRVAMKNGCDDWFVPSKEETEALRTAIDREGESLVSWFNNYYIASSSDATSASIWRWYYPDGIWGNNFKELGSGVFGVRSF